MKFVVDVFHFFIPAGAAGQTLSVLFAGWASEGAIVATFHASTAKFGAFNVLITLTKKGMENLSSVI